MLKNKNLSYLPYLIFAILTFLVLGPLFQPGFVFLLDMIPTPHVQLSDYTEYGFPPQMPIVILIKLLTSILPADLVQKIILTIILIMPALTMYKLARSYLPATWATISAIFYMINPYVYERFMAGHWLVLLGYGYFSCIVHVYRSLIENYTKSNLLRFTLLVSIYPIISLHWFYITVIFLIAYSIVFLFIKHKKTLKLITFNSIAQLLKNGLIILCTFLIINAFWIIPTTQGNTKISTITYDDLQVYATQADDNWGIYFNVLSLYGFWQRDFDWPKQYTPHWWMWTIITLAFSIIGACVLTKKKNILGITLLILFIPIVIIAVGYSDDLTQPIIKFLFNHLPGFKGLRETAKISGLIAFTYAFFLASGTKYLTDLIVKEYTGVMRQILKFTAVTTVAAVPLLMTNTIFWASRGQLQTSLYPDTWQHLQIQMSSDQNSRVLVLPWWAYYNFPFTQMRTIANPAAVYFNFEVIQSNSINNENKIRQQTQLDLVAASLKDNSNTENNLEYLKSQRITHILLFKVNNWEEYLDIQSSPQITSLIENQDYILYKIN